MQSQCRKVSSSGIVGLLSQCANLLLDLPIALTNLSSQVDKRNYNCRCPHNLCDRADSLPVHCLIDSLCVRPNVCFRPQAVTSQALFHTVVACLQVQPTVVSPLYRYAFRASPNSHRRESLLSRKRNRDPHHTPEKCPIHIAGKIVCVRLFQSRPRRYRSSFLPVLRTNWTKSLIQPKTDYPSFVDSRCNGKRM